MSIERTDTIRTADGILGTDAIAADDQGGALLAIDLLPIRYLRDLLALAMLRALDSRAPISTLRTRRTELGIALPELDTLTIWATRNDQGQIGIPFLDLVLDELLRRAEATFDSLPLPSPRMAGVARAAAAEIAALRNDVAAARIQNPDAGPMTFVPLDRLQMVCGPTGAITRVIHELQHMRADAVSGCTRIQVPPDLPAVRDADSLG